MSATRNVVVRGRVWWGEPFVKAVPQLVSCKDALGSAARTDDIII